MDTAGYFQKLEYYMEDNIRTTQKVYEYIKTTNLLKFILGKNEIHGYFFTFLACFLFVIIFTSLFFFTGSKKMLKK